MDRRLRRSHDGRHRDRRQPVPAQGVRQGDLLNGCIPASGKHGAPLHRGALFLSLALAAFAAGAADRTVATLADPAGDDHGAGALAYPQRDGFEPGDLDLTALRIVRTGAGYRFDATFRNKVRDPATVAGAAGPEPLSYFARRGFYAFNLDVYLDLDRVPGSGNTWALPGRGVAIDAAHAWDRAVVLTPRPELMRRQLVDALAHDEGLSDADAARRVDGLLHFATDVRVRGRTVSFEAPAAFLAGGRPDADWSAVALVTGAKIAIDADLDLLQAQGSALARMPLGAMQPKPGRPRDTLGYAGATPPAAVVDLLAPPPLDQGAVLAAAAPLPGVSWSPAGAAPAPGQGAPVTRLGGATAAPAAPAAPAADDIAARLRRLDALRAQGLISEAEHQEQRRRILGEL